jgi:hypothetical protein
MKRKSKYHRLFVSNDMFDIIVDNLDTHRKTKHSKV